MDGPLVIQCLVILFFYVLGEMLTNGYVVDTSGCVILDLDPFHPQVLPFIKNKKSLNCSRGKPLLVKSNSSTLYIDYSVLGAYGISKESELSCCYNTFYAVSGPTWKLSHKV